MKNLYTENYKTLMKETKTQINGKIFYAHRLEKVILLKCPYHPKQSTVQIPCNPYQNSSGIFHRNRTNNPKIYIEPQKTPNRQSKLEKE